MTVLAYSDGLVESRRQDLFTGIDVLRDVVADLAPGAATRASSAPGSAS